MGVAGAVWEDIVSDELMMEDASRVEWFAAIRSPHTAVACNIGNLIRFLILPPVWFL